MFNLDHTTRVITENLARTIDRRTFLKRTSQSVFAGMIAMAAGHGLAGQAGAARGGPKPQEPMVPQCAPPGPYCNLNGNNQDPNGCHGGHCYQHRYQGTILQCKVYYQWYQTGCWTTPVSGGYWTCCDCECFNGSQRVATCGCAQFSTTPQPSPDNPVAGKSNS